jgi:hypothetical protein
MKIYFSPEEVTEISLRAAQFVRAQDEAARTGTPLNFPMTKSLEFCLKFVRENYTSEDIRLLWQAAAQSVNKEP